MFMLRHILHYKVEVSQREGKPSFRCTIAAKQRLTSNKPIEKMLVRVRNEIVNACNNLDSIPLIFLNSYLAFSFSGRAEAKCSADSE